MLWCAVDEEDKTSCLCKLGGCGMLTFSLRTPAWPPRGKLPKHCCQAIDCVNSFTYEMANKEQVMHHAKP